MEFNLQVIVHLDLPSCLIGEPQNQTCEVDDNFYLTLDLEDNLNDDDYQDVPAAQPEPSPTNSQTFLGFASIMFVLWYVAAQGLPQPGTARIAYVSLLPPGRVFMK